MIFCLGMDKENKALLVSEYAKYEKKLHGDIIGDNDYLKLAERAISKTMKKHNNSFLGFYADNGTLLGVSRLYKRGYDSMFVSEIIVFNSEEFEAPLLENIYLKFLEQIEDIAHESEIEDIDFELDKKDLVMKQSLLRAGFSVNEQIENAEEVYPTIIYSKTLGLNRKRKWMQF